MISSYTGFAKFQRKIDGKDEGLVFTKTPFPRIIINLHDFKLFCRAIFEEGVGGTLSDEETYLLDKSFMWHTHKRNTGSWGDVYDEEVVDEDTFFYCSNWHLMMKSGDIPVEAPQEEEEYFELADPEEEDSYDIFF